MGITTAREKRNLPLYFDPRPACPAAEPLYGALRGSGVVCQVTKTEVTSSGDPSTLLAHCLADEAGYQLCPVWRAAREAEQAGRLRSFEREMATG